MSVFFLCLLAILVIIAWYQAVRWVLYHEQPRWFMWYFGKGKGIADEAEDFLNRRGEQ
mgnify:CR=1 FL=1